MNFNTTINFLFLVSALSVSCQRRSEISGTKSVDVPVEDVLFQVPDCLPNCTSADQPRLAAASEIENRIVEAINAAKTSVQFSMYTFSRKPIYEALLAAAARNVRVQGVMDRAQFKTTSAVCKPGGCNFEGPLERSVWGELSLSERLTRAAAEPIFKDGSNTDKLALVLDGLNGGSGVRPLPGQDRLVHNKYVMIDNSILLSGSGNWSSTAVSLNLENLVTYDQSTAPNVVEGTACSFNLFWHGDSNAISRGIAACQRSDELYLSPAPQEPVGPQARILQSIKSSQSNIDISMHHLADPEVFIALEEARSRRVEVRLLADDDYCNARPDAKLTSLLATGAKMKFVPTTCSIFQLSHSKYGIFDGAEVINGSANWSKAGLKKNYENFVVFKSGEAVGAFKNNFEQLWSLAVEKQACQCDASTAECQKKYCLTQ